MKKEQKSQSSNIPLLEAFWAQKIKDHLEPVRKGTPKGEPIGFSNKKHAAALLSMKKIPLKKMAKAVGVSYGLLRKWRSEDGFIDLVDNLELEFAGLLIKRLKERAAKQTELTRKYFKMPIDEMANASSPVLTWNEFGDIQHYTNTLMLRISGAINKEGASIDKRILKAPQKELLNTQLVALHYQIVNFCQIVMLNYKVKEKDKSAIAKIEKINTEMESFQGRLALSLIRDDWSQKGGVTDESLRSIIYILHHLSGLIMPVDILPEASYQTAEGFKIDVDMAI